MIVHVETISGKNLKRIGRFHLSANPARFERPKASTFQKEKPVPSGLSRCQQHGEVNDKEVSLILSIYTDLLTNALKIVLEGTFKDRFPRPVLDEISSSDCSDALLLIDRGFLDGHFIINGLVFLSWLYWISALFSLTIRRLRVSSWCRYPDNCGAEAAMSIDSWVKCPKVLASKKLGGLGVSRSLTCLNGHVLSDAFNSHGGSIITEVTPLKSKVEDLISLVEFVCGKMVTGTSLLMVLGLKWRWCFSSKVVDLLLDEAFSLQWKFLLGWIKSMFASCLWLVLLCDHVLRDSSHLSSVSLCGERVFILQKY
ncbi:hypothetical protein Tco_0415259 [Tanacetum coccineum]